MQAIARANRVYPGKSCGIIVDYVNVFKYMQKALSQYAVGDSGTEFPEKDIRKLLDLIDNTIAETDIFLKLISVDLDAILGESETFEKLDELDQAYNVIVAKDDNKEKFKVLSNTLANLYEASKPEVFELHWKNKKYGAISYLHGLFHNQIDSEKIKRARLRMCQVLDCSI